MLHRNFNQTQIIHVIENQKEEEEKLWKMNFAFWMDISSDAQAIGWNPSVILECYLAVGI